MDRDTAMFVQFPHPGGEHYPPTDTMPWNLGRHRRKFLRSGGRLVHPDGRHSVAEVVFWGEWEAPSWIERRWPAGGGLPRALHRPYWFRPASDSPRQNTDPWVFGERMLYSNCRQLSPGPAPTSMPSLPRGSLICFGSAIDTATLIDRSRSRSDRAPHERAVDAFCHFRRWPARALRGARERCSPLVFVHGWSCDRTYWNGQVGYFADRHQVVAVDLAGHGESGLGRPAWTMPEFGNDVVAVADQLGLSDMVLIGHSMGGDVIVEAALRLGDRVIGLVWVDVYRTLREEADPEDAVEEFLRPFHTDFQPRPTTSCGRCSRPAQLSTWPTGWQLTWRRLRHRWRSTR